MTELPLSPNVKTIRSVFLSLNRYISFVFFFFRPYSVRETKGTSDGKTALNHSLSLQAPILLSISEISPLKFPVAEFFRNPATPSVIGCFESLVNGVCDGLLRRRTELVSGLGECGPRDRNLFTISCCRV